MRHFFPVLRGFKGEFLSNIVTVFSSFIDKRLDVTRPATITDRLFPSLKIPLCITQYYSLLRIILYGGCFVWNPLLIIWSCRVLSLSTDRTLFSSIHHLWTRLLANILAPVFQQFYFYYFVLKVV